MDSRLTLMLLIIAFLLFPIAIACGAIVYVDTSVFNQFKLIKPIDQWPQAGRLLVDIAEIIKYWWWLAILGIFAVGWFVQRKMINYTKSTKTTMLILLVFSGSLLVIGIALIIVVVRGIYLTGMAM